MPYPIRTHDDKAVLRTDGSIDQFTAYQQAEKIFDPNDQPIAYPRDDGTADAAAVAATAVLTSDNTETQDSSLVVIGTVTYRIISTMAQAYDVKRNGTTADTTLLALAKAVNASGVAGTDYFAGTLAHPAVTASETITSHKLTLTAKNTGTAGNALASTVSVSTHLTFGGATFSGGKQEVHQGYTHKVGGVGSSGTHQSAQLRTDAQDDPSKAIHNANPTDVP